MKKTKIYLAVIMLGLSVSMVDPIPTISHTSTTVIAKSTTVLITKTGRKYHKKKCGNGKFTKTTLEKAKKDGLTKCKKCYGE
jgi:hypothetical protein